MTRMAILKHLGTLTIIMQVIVTVSLILAPLHYYVWVIFVNSLGWLIALIITFLVIRYTKIIRNP